MRSFVTVVFEAETDKVELMSAIIQGHLDDMMDYEKELGSPMISAIIVEGHRE